MSELKPCPFCGLFPKLLDAGGGVVFVACPPGPCSESELLIGFSAEKKPKAIAAWNRRASPTPECIRREALEEAARIAERGCLVPPDGGSPTEAEREMCEAIAASIRALSPPVKD